MNLLIATYLDECHQLRAGKTYRDYKGRLTLFDQFIPEKPEWTRQLTVSYLLHLKAGGTGSASIFLHETTIKTFYSWLVITGHLPLNPLQGKPIMPYTSPKRDEDFAFTVKEYEAVKKFCRKHERYKEWYGAVLVGWNTGLRLADVMRLGREHISKNVLTVEPQKTVRFHKIIKMPISKEMTDWLDGFQELPERFFPSLYNRYQGCDASVSQQFGRICRACYVSGKAFHGLRHAFLSRHLNAGVPISIISSMTGQTMKVLQRYSHVTVEDQRKALERMVA